MATTPENQRIVTDNGYADANSTTREPPIATTTGEPRMSAPAGESQKATASGESRMSTAQLAGMTSDRQPVDRKGMDQSSAERNAALFPGTEAETFHSRWSDIQAGFVDEPRRAVEQADSLVAEVMQRLAQVFADERGRLEGQWDRGEDTDTEALRQALRRYRSFFDRLLAL
jgi:hypothetical protein